MPAYEYLLRTQDNTDDLSYTDRSHYPCRVFQGMADHWGAQGWRVVQCHAPNPTEVKPEWWLLFEREVERSDAE